MKRRAAQKDIEGVEPHERPVDFAVELKRQIEETERILADPDSKEARGLGFDGRMGPPEVLWLIRARWAEARGERDLATRCLALVERVTTGRSCSGDCDMAARLREGFQQKLLWQAIDGLSDFMPRPEVIDLARRARSIAPAGRLAAQAGDFIAALEKAVAEDTAHARSEIPPWDSLSAERKADELVYMLRDQNGHQMSQPGACDPFDVWPGTRNPAQELLTMGRKIVSRLIPEVGNPIPTRSIGYHRDFYFSHHALTVGEVALNVIENITGKNFSPEGKTPEALRAEVGAYWARVGSMSERDVLIEALHNASEWERSGVAHKLLAVAGMEVWDELVRAFKGTKEAGARAAMLEIMSYGSRVSAGQGNTIVLNTRPEQKGQERDTIVRFLAQALQDPAPEVRRAAAKALASRGDPRGARALLTELTAPPKEGSSSSGYEDEEAIRLIFEAKTPGAAAAIAREVRRGNGSVIEGLASALGSICGRGAPPRCKLGLSDQAALLDALAAALESKSMPFDGSIGSGPRRARDQEARAFGALRGIADVDVWSKGPFEGDRAILKMLNDYRAEKKLPPLVRPELDIPEKPASPGPDDHRTVRRVHEESEKPEVRAMGTPFLERWKGKPLDVDAITAALVELGAKNTLIGWKLRIVRLPEERGVLLFLRGWPLTPTPGQMSLYSIQCDGSESCGGGTMQGGDVKSAVQPFAKDIRAAWAAKPKGGEEYTLTLIGDNVTRP